MDKYIKKLCLLVADTEEIINWFEFLIKRNTDFDSKDWDVLRKYIHELQNKLINLINKIE